MTSRVQNIMNKLPKYALVLFDIDGCTASGIPTSKITPTPYKSAIATLTYGKEKFKVEILELSDSKDDLSVLEDEWASTQRAKAIDLEITSRQNKKQKEHGFLDIWPKEKNSQIVTTVETHVPTQEQHALQIPAAVPQEPFQVHEKEGNSRKITVFYEGSADLEPGSSVPKRQPRFYDGLTQDQIDIVNHQISNLDKNQTSKGVNTHPVIVLADDKSLFEAVNQSVPTQTIGCQTFPVLRTEIETQTQTKPPRTIETQTDQKPPCTKETQTDSKPPSIIQTQLPTKPSSTIGTQTDTKPSSTIGTQTDSKPPSTTETQTPFQWLAMSTNPSLEAKLDQVLNLEAKIDNFEVKLDRVLAILTCNNKSDTSTSHSQDLIDIIMNSGQDFLESPVPKKKRYNLPSFPESSPEKPAEPLSTIDVDAVQSLVTLQKDPKPAAMTFQPTKPAITSEPSTSTPLQNHPAFPQNSEPLMSTTAVPTHQTRHPFKQILDQSDTMYTCVPFMNNQENIVAEVTSWKEIAPYHTEVRLHPQTQAEIFNSSCSYQNFAWNVAKRLYRQEELQGRNFHGKRGKPGMSPRRKRAIEHAMINQYGTQMNLTTAITSINSGIRNMKKN